MQIEAPKTRMNQALLEGLRREDSGKVVLMYSGGIDSTAVGLMLGEQGKEVYPIFIAYGQSAQEAERFLAENAPETLGFKPCAIVETDLLQQLTKSKLLGGQAFNDSDAWVPGRNTLFMVIAGIYAQQIDADSIAIGYMLDDNFVFGDNDFFHHQSVEATLSRSFLRPIQVLLPARAMTKKDLVELLKSKGLLELTVSCWNAQLEDGKITSCNECANCLERNSQLKGINGDTKTT